MIKKNNSAKSNQTDLNTKKYVSVDQIYELYG
jgi:hypothetical protein